MNANIRTHIYPFQVSIISNVNLFHIYGSVVGGNGFNLMISSCYVTKGAVQNPNYFLALGVIKTPTRNTFEFPSV